MATTAAVRRTALLAWAVSLGLFLGGCRPEPMTNGMHGNGVIVVQVRDGSRTHREPGFRSYGPTMLPAKGDLWPTFFGQDRILFEIANDGDAPIGWVVWDYRYRVHVRTQSPYGTDGPVWRGEGWERCGYVGDLPPSGSVMCAVALGLRGDREWVSGGEVLGCLAGSGRGRPRTGLTAGKYTGPEWLAPHGKFVRKRLDEALRQLRTSGAGNLAEGMQTLLAASRLANDGLPVVRKPEIVAFFVEQVLKAKPRLAAEDEELPLTVDVPEFALLVLLDLVPPGQLKAHAESLGALAVHAGDRRVVELLLKAGAVKALKDLAANPARLPSEGREDLLLAIRAGAGDGKTFAGLLEEFAAAKEPARKVALGRLLAMIGREEGLRAVAGQMRDLRHYREGRTDDRCVRYELMESLRLAFPDEPALYVSRSCTREEMAGVEEFCARRFRVKFEGPPPERSGEAVVGAPNTGQPPAAGAQETQHE